MKKNIFITLTTVLFCTQLNAAPNSEYTAILNNMISAKASNELLGLAIKEGKLDELADMAKKAFNKKLDAMKSGLTIDNLLKNAPKGGGDLAKEFYDNKTGAAKADWIINNLSADVVKALKGEGEKGKLAANNLAKSLEIK